MNFIEHHLGDYLKLAAHLALLEHGAFFRLRDVYLATEVPLPDGKVERLVGARSPDEVAAVRAVLAEFFELTEAGWRRAQFDEAIQEYAAGEPARAAKKSNAAIRQHRHREERTKLFEQLRAAGQHADWNINTDALRTLVRALPAAPATPPVTPATAPATAKASEALQVVAGQEFVRADRSADRAADLENAEESAESADSTAPATAPVTPETSQVTAPETPATATQSPLPTTHYPNKEKTYTRIRKPVKTPIAEDFAISASVKAWAERKGHTELEERLEHFVCQARMQGYLYADWDSALKRAIREDWARLTKTASGGRGSGAKARVTSFADVDYEEAA